MKFWGFCCFCCCCCCCFQDGRVVRRLHAVPALLLVFWVYIHLLQPEAMGTRQLLQWLLAAKRRRQQQQQLQLQHTLQQQQQAIARSSIDSSSSSSRMRPDLSRLTLLISQRSRTPAAVAAATTAPTAVAAAAAAAAAGEPGRDPHLIACGKLLRLFLLRHLLPFAAAELSDV